MTRKKDSYEPALDDLTPKPRASAPAQPSPAAEAPRQRAMMDADTAEPSPPRLRSEPAARPRASYEPNLEDLTPKPRAQPAASPSRAAEVPRPHNPINAAPPPASAPQRSPSEPAATSSSFRVVARVGAKGYEPDLADLTPKSRAPTSAPPSAPSQEPSARRTKDRHEEPEYLPGFEPIPGSQGPPGPTPAVMAELERRGMLSETEPPPRPTRLREPERNGPAPATIEELKRRGMWTQEDQGSAPPANPGVGSTSRRPTQAEILSSQHPPLSSRPDLTAGSAPVARAEKLEGIPPTRAAAAGEFAPARSQPARSEAETPPQPAPPAAPNLTPQRTAAHRPADSSPRAWEGKQDYRANRTLGIPRSAYTQLCEMSDKRGVSVNAVILGILAEACAGRWAGQLVPSKRTGRVRRTVRIPWDDYQQLRAMADARKVGMNAVILGVLAEACSNSTDT